MGHASTSPHIRHLVQGLPSITVHPRFSPPITSLQQSLSHGKKKSYSDIPTSYLNMGARFDLPLPPSLADRCLLI
jgi:hypothetical protein